MIEQTSAWPRERVTTTASLRKVLGPEPKFNPVVHFPAQLLPARNVAFGRLGPGNQGGHYLQFIRGLRGNLLVTLEEGTWAARVLLASKRADRLLAEGSCRFE